MLAGARLVLDFGPKRRALQTICADVLDILLPKYDFDYLAKGKGADQATLRRKEIIEKGGFTWVVAADITNAFGSINKEKLAALLPLPTPVVKNVLLVQDEVVVKLADQEVTNELFNLPLCISTHVYSSTDTAARMGLPQGSLASNLIMSRSVLDPLINATPLADRTVVYGDDITVAAKSEMEAEDILHALRSILENSPVGPLAIGRHSIRHIHQGVHFAKYSLKQDPWTPGGTLRAYPSPKSFDRFSWRAERKFLNGPQEGAAQRVFTYGDIWPKAFPLWEPNETSLDLLWLTTFEAIQKAEQSQK